MIDFKCSKRNLERAVFAGSPDMLMAEIFMQVNLVYGNMYKHNKDAAKEFKRTFVMSIIDPEVQSHVFSDDVVNALERDSGGFYVESYSVDKRGLAKQLLDLLENGNEDE